MTHFYKVKRSVYYKGSWLGTSTSRLITSNEKADTSFTLNGWEEIEKRRGTLMNAELWMDCSIFGKKRILMSGCDPVIREKKDPSPVLECKVQYTEYIPTVQELMDCEVITVVDYLKERNLI